MKIYLKNSPYSSRINPKSESICLKETSEKSLETEISYEIGLNFFSVLWHCWLDMGCWYHVCKTKDDQTTGCSCSALTLIVKQQEGHLAHKNLVVVSVSLFFVRVLAHPCYSGIKGRKAVVYSLMLWNKTCTRMLIVVTRRRHSPTMSSALPVVSITGCLYSLSAF